MKSRYQLVTFAPSLLGQGQSFYYCNHVPIEMKTHIINHSNSLTNKVKEIITLHPGL